MPEVAPAGGVTLEEVSAQYAGGSTLITVDGQPTPVCAQDKQAVAGFTVTGSSGPYTLTVQATVSSVAPGSTPISCAVKHTNLGECLTLALCSFVLISCANSPLVARVGFPCLKGQARVGSTAAVASCCYCWLLLSGAVPRPCLPIIHMATHTSQASLHIPHGSRPAPCTHIKLLHAFTARTAWHAVHVCTLLTCLVLSAVWLTRPHCCPVGAKGGSTSVSCSRPASGWPAPSFSIYLTAKDASGLDTTASAVVPTAASLTIVPAALQKTVCQNVPNFRSQVT